MANYHAPKSAHDDGDQDSAGYDAKAQGSRGIKQAMRDVLSRWYWIVLFLILGVLGSHYYLSKKPKVYTATCTLLVKHTVASVLSRGQAEEVNMSGSEGMNTVAEQIRTFEVMQMVAGDDQLRSMPGLVPAPVNWMPDWLDKKLGNNSEEEVSKEPPAPALLAGMIGSWTRVSTRRYTRLLDISVTHPNPEVAKEVANKIADYYFRVVSKASRDGRGGSMDLLTVKSGEAQTQEQKDSAVLATYQRSLELHAELDKRETELDRVALRYRDKHPKKVEAVALMEDAKERFLKDFKAVLTQKQDEEYWKGVGLPDDAANPGDYLVMARQKLLARVGKLDGDIARAKKIVDTMETKKKDLELDQNAQNVIVEPSSFARVPGPPSGPDRQKIQTSGAMGGLMLGVGLALLLGRLDNRYHTVAQVSAETGAPVLAAISEIKPGDLKRAERDQKRRNGGTLQDGPEEWNKMLLFRPGAANTTYAEMFRVLRASVSLLGDETKRKVTLFTSALPGEGKSSISTNFALAAASQGKRTLLIDFDLRKPSLHRLLGSDRNPPGGGLTDFLANQAPLHEVAVPVPGTTHLHLVASGNRAPNPGELMDAVKIRELLILACRHFDVVVLDTAPLLSVPDTRILLPLVNNACLVVRAEYTRKKAFERALSIFDEDRSSLSGVVVNAYREKRRLMGENFSYGYYGSDGSGGYGAYGAYGHDDDDGDKPKKKTRKVRSA
ncbi:tyrosine-protein kinase domain-containing protein [Luteolibacter luteus]|uniref:Polysaccharide biosynthesis tyrosine autokinase n=1 Tax=Luteolibacter luteus TaxID=2728835 RepID=A0A858RDL7_9BACT|nr:polysaccharide biosynthesis tyrosine autokinase [Luteolibacter luteus]QJE94273.1 polysaccharide biosynthesis tyrosine autokinase [Luteolibacter luteus]